MKLTAVAIAASIFSLAFNGAIISSVVLAKGVESSRLLSKLETTSSLDMRLLSFASTNPEFGIEKETETFFIPVSIPVGTTTVSLVTITAHESAMPSTVTPSSLTTIAPSSPTTIASTANTSSASPPSFSLLAAAPVASSMLASTKIVASSTSSDDVAFLVSLTACITSAPSPTTADPSRRRTNNATELFPGTGGKLPGFEAIGIPDSGAFSLVSDVVLAGVVVACVLCWV